MKYFFTLFIVLAGLLSCKKDDPDDSAQCQKYQTDLCKYYAQLDTATGQNIHSLNQAIEFTKNGMKREGCTIKSCQ